MADTYNNAAAFKVKCWTEAGVNVCAKLNEFVYLSNMTPDKKYFRGHTLEPMETFFSTESSVVSGIFHQDSRGIVRAVQSSKTLPPREPKAWPAPPKRYIKLKNGRHR